MIGKIDIIRSKRGKGKRVRAETSANARPSRVLTAPTSTANPSEFHATPQLRPPVRQASPQIDRAVILSANPPSASAPALSLKAEMRMHATG
jgi:hypothetical protein